MRSSDWSSDVCSSDLVGEFGGRKMAREFERGHPAHVRPVARVEHIGEGNLLPSARHVERDVIVAREEHQLVAKIIGEQVGTRYRGFEDARAFEAAEGEIMTPLPLALFAGGGEANGGIVEQALSCGELGRAHY